MEIGLSSASFYPYVNTENSIDLMNRLGFKSGEIFLNSPSEYEEDFIKKLSDRSKELQFKIHSVHGFSSAFEPYLFDSYKRRRDDMFKYFKKVCRAAKLLNANCYTFHGMRYMKLDYENMKNIVDIYDKLCYTALEEGIKLAQENVSWCMSADLNFLKDLKEKCKYPLNFTLDIKQACRAGQSVESYISVMGESLINFHLNDVNDSSTCLLPGKGNIDYKKICCKLKEIGYNKIGIIEVYSDNYKAYDEIISAKEFLTRQF